MNALRRMLDVLNLITPKQPAVSVEQICRQLGYAPASTYRYVRELTDAGLLVRLPSGYALGPRIIEMDLQIRENDPMLTSSQALMIELARETGLSVLLSQLYADKVITIHQEFGLDGNALSFGRGRPITLFRSATSRIILAHLPSRQLKRVYETNANNPDLRRLGSDWPAFSKAMRECRRAGWCASHGELDPDMMGVAAPIFDDKRRVIGSITLVGNRRRFGVFNEDYLSRSITAAARDITARIGANAHGPRAGPPAGQGPATDAPARPARRTARPQRQAKRTSPSR